MIKVFLTVLLLLFVNVIAAAKNPRIVTINNSPISVYANRGDQLVFISADGNQHKLKLYNGQTEQFNVNINKQSNQLIKMDLLGQYTVVDSISGKELGLISVKEPGSRKSIDSAKYQGEWYEKDAKDQMLKNQELNAKPDELKQDANAKPKTDAKSKTDAKPNTDELKQDANVKPKTDSTKPKTDAKPSDAVKPKTDATKPKTDTIDEADTKAKQEDTQPKDKVKESNNEGNSGSMLTINAVIVVASILSALLI